jgi:hypothetical protein
MLRVPKTHSPNRTEKASLIIAGRSASIEILCESKILKIIPNFYKLGKSDFPQRTAVAEIL